MLRFAGRARLGALLSTQFLWIADYFVKSEFVIQRPHHPSICIMFPFLKCLHLESFRVVLTLCAKPGKQKEFHVADSKHNEI